MASTIHPASTKPPTSVTASRAGRYVSNLERFWKAPESRSAKENLLGQLDKQDLLSLRLACHDTTKPTAPHIFKEVTVTFKSTTFTKPARLAALARIGQYVRRLTFKMPHGDETFLPPLLEPTTGSEVEYVYTPNCQVLKSKPSRAKLVDHDDGSKELSDLLIKQYPPLYHAAVNVPSFVRAFSHLLNLKYLVVSCPSAATRALSSANKSIVDHALVSLRIAIERNNLPKLENLTLTPIHAQAIQYLTPMLGLGARPNSMRRWRQIKHLTIHMPVTTSQAQLKILHAYIGVFSPSLKTLTFHWLAGPIRPSSAGNPSIRLSGSMDARAPARPSSTGSSYFPRTIKPRTSSISEGGRPSPDLSMGNQRGANPLTLHMSAFLQQDTTPRKASSKPLSAPKPKTSSSSLDSMQSLTSATTLSSTASTPSPSRGATPTPSPSRGATPTTSPIRRPKLRCEPTYQSHPPSSPTQPPRKSSLTPSPPSSPRPLHFPHLTFFELDSILCSAHEISTFIAAHGRSLSEFKFEATTLTSGDWDAALAPLTALAGGSDAWKREARREEEVPICLGPELSPVRGREERGLLVGGELGTEGRLLFGESGVAKEGGKKNLGADFWKSPLLGMRMGMGRDRDRGIAGGCAAEAKMEREMGLGGMRGGWNGRARKRVGGGSQEALEDGVRKLLAQTVFPWF